MEDETPVSLEMMGLDFNPVGILHQNASEGWAQYRFGTDAQLHVEFYSKRVPQLSASKDGVMVFEQKDYVKIMKPGAKSWPERPAREADKQRFPSQWLRYKQGQSQQVGTSIDTLVQQGLITPNQQEMLTQAKVFTMEQLAAASEAVITGFGPDGEHMQKMARGYLRYRKEIESRAQAEEIKDIKAKTESKVSTIEEQLKEAQEAIKALTSLVGGGGGGGGKKRGRPAKAADESSETELTSDESAVA